MGGTLYPEIREIAGPEEPRMAARWPADGARSSELRTICDLFYPSGVVSRASGLRPKVAHQHVATGQGITRGGQGVRA